MIERVFVAEKPKMGQAIAKYLAGAHQCSVREDIGCLTVGTDVVTWANGHLFEDAKFEAYDASYKEWRREHYPFIPDDWRRVPKHGALDHLQTLRKVLAQAKVVIHACDLDREGQMIGNELFERLGVACEVLRAPVKGYSTGSIRKAIDKLATNRTYKPLAEAAAARAEADGLIGWNLSPLYTLSARDAGWIKSGEAVAIGRVVSPTLTLIVGREREIADFMPTEFFRLAIAVESPAGLLAFEWQSPKDGDGIDDDHHRVIDRALVDAVAERVSKLTVGHIVSVEDTPGEAPPPLPHTLSSLQIQMNKEHGMTATQVADLAEKLYSTHFLISYPRANCRFYEEEDFESAPRCLEAIAQNIPRYAQLVGLADVGLKSRAWDNEKVGAHGAMAPLDTILVERNLTAPEQIVYEAICRSYLAQFFLPATSVTRSIVVHFGTDFFEYRVTKPAEWGWKIVKGDPPSETQDAPTAEVGQKAILRGVRVIDNNFTTPPKRFTDGSLIQALNAIEKFVVDPDLRAVLGSGAALGTEATQSGIIESLLKSGYVLRQDAKKGKDKATDGDPEPGKFLVPTKFGMLLADRLPDPLKGPALTAIHEQALRRVERGEMPSAAFLRVQRTLVREMCDFAQTVTFPKRDEWDPDSKEKRRNEQGRSAA